MASFGSGPGNYSLSLYLDGKALHAGSNVIDVYSVVLPEPFNQYKLTWNQVIPTAKHIGSIKANFVGFSNHLKMNDTAGSDFLFLMGKGQHGGLTVMDTDYSNFHLEAL